MANASKKLHLLRLISCSVEIDCLNCVVRSLSVVPQVRLLVVVWLKRAKNPQVGGVVGVGDGKNRE